jgi:chemotaxis protein CheX
MQFLENEICQIVESIWTAVLELDLRRTARTSAPLGEEATLDGCVQITGAWEGAVILHCSATLAAQVAGIIFGAAPEEATSEMTQDALGELTNMAGGNLKALLPQPCALSLPSVTKGTNYHVRVPGSTLITQVAFECLDQLLVVTLRQRQPASREVTRTPAFL